MSRVSMTTFSLFPLPTASILRRYTILSFSPLDFVNHFLDWIRFENSIFRKFIHSHHENHFIIILGHVMMRLLILMSAKFRCTNEQYAGGATVTTTTSVCIYALYIARENIYSFA